MVVDRHVPREKRNILQRELRLRRLFEGQLEIPELLRRLQHQLPVGILHRAAAVENLGDRVSGQTAGVGHILYRHASQRHSASSQIGK